MKKTVMKRLTKRYEEEIIRNTDGVECSNFCTNCGRADCEHISKVLRKLAHYEDLEEQGRLIELPCTVGDTVWSTRWWDNKKISKKIDGEIWYRDIFQHKVTKEKFLLSDIDRIGIDVFLTKEEAEEKLKEMRGAE